MVFYSLSHKQTKIMYEDLAARVYGPRSSERLSECGSSEEQHHYYQNHALFPFFGSRIFQFFRPRIFFSPLSIPTRYFRMHHLKKRSAT